MILLNKTFSLLVVVCAIGFVLVTLRTDFIKDEAAPIDKINAEKNGASAGHEMVPRNQLKKNPFEDDHDSKNVSVVLMAGQPISVDWKSLDTKMYVLPEKYNAAELYERLEAKALAGDAVAARVLAFEIERCNDAFFDGVEHANSIDLVRNDKSYISPRGVAVKVDFDGDGMDRFIDQLNNEYRHCEDLSLEKRGHSTLWARYAAERGDFQATLLLKDLIVEPSEKIDQLLVLWEDFGYVDALYELAVLNYQAEDDWVPSQTKSRKSLSVSYLLLAGKLKTIALMPGDTVDKPNFLSSRDQALRMLSADLSAADHLDAEEYALELFRNNPNCCADIRH